jgi:hypothetical protein
MNLIQKLHALLVSDSVNVWHFHHAQPPVKPFCYWVHSGRVEGESFDTLDEMIEAAYAHIDPLKMVLPAEVPLPNSIRMHTPGFVEGVWKEVAYFFSTADLLRVPWVSSWRDIGQGRKFLRFSKSDELLMAEFDDRGVRCSRVVGYIERPAEVDLPAWSKGD